MYTVLIILAVIAGILLTLVVLIQESKGGGLASGFSASNAIMGVRKTTDFVEKSRSGSQRCDQYANCSGATNATRPARRWRNADNTGTVKSTKEEASSSFSFIPYI